MRVKEDSEKGGLKLNIQKTKTMASSPITSWQVEQEKVEAVTDFIFLGSKITVDSDCSHGIRKTLAPWKKRYDHPRQCIKKQRRHFADKGPYSHMVFPVVVYGCESWTIKKAECQTIDAFQLWCWRRLRVLWTARKSNQSVLKEFNPEYSLEGLILKLKLQYLGHLIPRTNSLEKILILGKVEGRRRRG